jgi:glycine C-acetyltransferase
VPRTKGETQCPKAFLTRISETLDTIRADGLWKTERPIVSPRAGISPSPRRARHAEPLRQQLPRARRHPALIAAATSAAMDATATAWPACASSAARRTCTGAGNRLAEFLGKDDAILFAACFDANGGLFEPLLGPEDAVISDALNHASIIDGIRLCKARRYRYANADMDDLEAQLKAARPTARARS